MPWSSSLLPSPPSLLCYWQRSIIRLVSLRDFSMWCRVEPPQANSCASTQMWPKSHSRGVCPQVLRYVYVHVYTYKVLSLLNNKVFKMFKKFIVQFTYLPVAKSTGIPLKSQDLLWKCEDNFLVQILLLNCMLVKMIQ